MKISFKRYILIHPTQGTDVGSIVIEGPPILECRCRRSHKR